jgi:omega-amidase
MEDLKISYIQSNLHWEFPEENLRMFSRKIAGITEETDLIILPEMFTTGFTMHPSLYAQTMDGIAVEWMKETALERNCVIAGSMAMEEGVKHFNRFLWVRPDGSTEQYDKRHLFGYGGEDAHYTAGSEKLITGLKGWKVRPFVCYDLRFPVWSRNRWKQSGEKLEAEYDLAIYAANWPERRSLPWKTLLAARAMENQVYVTGVNRVGVDGEGLEYAGDSAVISFKGDLLSKPNSGTELHETITLSYKELMDFRLSFPAGRDADEFTLA